MANERYNDQNVRLCDERKCDLEATHTLLWTNKWQCYCLEHAIKAVNIGLALGFYSPQQSLRGMTDWEKVKHD